MERLSGIERIRVGMVRRRRWVRLFSTDSDSDVAGDKSTSEGTSVPVLIPVLGGLFCRVSDSLCTSLVRCSDGRPRVKGDCRRESCESERFCSVGWILDCGVPARLGEELGEVGGDTPLLKLRDGGRVEDGREMFTGDGAGGLRVPEELCKLEELIRGVVGSGCLAAKTLARDVW